MDTFLKKYNSLKKTPEERENPESLNIEEIESIIKIFPT